MYWSTDIYRDAKDREFIYEPIASIEFQGTVDSSGDSSRHYICFVKSSYDGQWFLTNDNDEPKLVSKEEITKLSYVTLLKQKDKCDTCWINHPTYPRIILILCTLQKIYLDIIWYHRNPSLYLKHTYSKDLSKKDRN